MKSAIKYWDLEMRNILKGQRKLGKYFSSCIIILPGILFMQHKNILKFPMVKLTLCFRPPA